MDDQMTTLTITKQNAHHVMDMIMERLEHGDMLIDLYDDTTYNPIVRS